MSKGPGRWLLLAPLAAASSIGISLPAAPPALVEPVNMTFHEGRLLVSDRTNGIHIYDVADPSAPAPEMVIPLRGNMGTAARDDIIYANSYGSLLAIRVTGESYEIAKEIRREPRGVDFMFIDTHDDGFGCACSRRDDPVVAPASDGTGSSFATFAVMDDYLYYLDYGELVTMDISTPEDPVEVSRVVAGRDVQTLYPTADYLYLGGIWGMTIFDRADPFEPAHVGQFNHFRGCDPVVVSGDIAWVTIRGGNRCGQTRDVLLCIDVSVPSEPKLVAEKPMPTPYGLAIDAPLLYVSAGYNGFALLDVATPATPNPVAAWSERPTKDFIWRGNILYTLSFDGIVIFDVTVPDRPTVLSELRSRVGS